MKRDFELIRKLLVFFYEKEGPEHVMRPDVGGEYTDSEIQYHLRLLYQAGLLNCEPEKSSIAFLRGGINWWTLRFGRLSLTTRDQTNQKRRACKCILHRVVL